MKVGEVNLFLEARIASASEFFMLSQKPPNSVVILTSKRTINKKNNHQLQVLSIKMLVSRAGNMWKDTGNFNQKLRNRMGLNIVFHYKAGRFCYLCLTLLSGRKKRQLMTNPQMPSHFHATHGQKRH